MKNKFKPEELSPRGSVRGRGNALPVFSSPITSRENMRLAYERKRPVWIPFTYEVHNFNPRIFRDNCSRAMIQEARPASPSEYGGPDMFGVPWVFDPASGGSMVAPGNPMLTELADWEKTIVFPDPASWDWDGCAAENAGYFDTELPVKLTIFTGLFERLISFMNFEPAIISLIDEDEKAHVHALFSRLCDMYEEMITLACKRFPIDIICFHDDWGSQRAPFFSLSTCMEMLVPYLKRVADCCHRNGVFIEFHSCGKNEMLVPAMIEAGVDSWSCQPLNDTVALRRQYGDRLIFNLWPPKLVDGCRGELMDTTARVFIEEQAPGYDTAPFMINTADIRWLDEPEALEYTAALYKYGRMAMDKD